MNELIKVTNQQSMRPVSTRRQCETSQYCIAHPKDKSQTQDFGLAYGSLASKPSSWDSMMDQFSFNQSTIG